MCCYYWSSYYYCMWSIIPNLWDIYFIFGLFDHLLALSRPKESAQYTFTRALLHHQTQSNIFGLHTCFRTVQEWSFTLWRIATQVLFYISQKESSRTHLRIVMTKASPPQSIVSKLYYRTQILLNWSVRWTKPTSLKESVGKICLGRYDR